jgi:23S rRNA (pseudouridine1915-N3)-methyltransferase
MLLTLAHIGPKSPKTGDKAAYETLTRLYLDRIQPYIPTHPETFPTEAAFLTWLTRPKQSGTHSRTSTRVPILPVFLDSRGRQLSSRELASWLGARRDQGFQHIVFAIGPPDGWSESTRELASAQSGLLLSFGPITMPHELARLVLAEQLYRACTILAGHPYHSGH